MAKKKMLPEETLRLIEEELQKESIPYNYDTKEYPVEVLVQKLDKDQIFVPTYQREFVWTKKQRSRFIESVFLGVPIMPLLVSMSGDNYELEIIDGTQRIRTLKEYVSGGLKLSGLEKLTVLNGTKFSDLPQARQNKFLLRDFRVHVISEESNVEVRADIFKRVNTSNSKLTASETRKGIYQSPFYNFIIECAKNEKFHKLCPISKTKEDRGEYEELVLRFFAYSEKYLKFKHDVAPFLDKYVKDNQDSFDRETMLNKFLRMLDFVEDNFPKPYFTKLDRINSTPRVRFEAISVGVALALEEKPDLKNVDLSWLNSEEFEIHTTSDASNNPGRLKDRVEFVKNSLLNIG
ncbi:MAG: DUF262 domain-containing protein [Muribaculaceae bacterium]|nr:DUF262 domain-containing protein [Muribaculaceae bacterium]